MHDVKAPEWGFRLIRAGLCRMPDLNFREFLFYAVG
jgi:hypothetical protein